jgi:hypothetical protein
VLVETKSETILASFVDINVTIYTQLRLSSPPKFNCTFQQTKHERAHPKWYIYAWNAIFTHQHDRRNKLRHNAGPFNLKVNLDNKDDTSKNYAINQRDWNKESSKTEKPSRIVGLKGKIKFKAYNWVSNLRKIYHPYIAVEKLLCSEWVERCSGFVQGELIILDVAIAFALYPACLLNVAFLSAE